MSDFKAILIVKVFITFKKQKANMEPYRRFKINARWVNEVCWGFFIKKYIRGTKKGQEYIKTTKRYVWSILKELENEIQVGDEVLVETTWIKDNKYISGKTKVLVVNVFEKDEDQEERKNVLKILNKYKC